MKADVPFWTFVGFWLLCIIWMLLSFTAGLTALVLGLSAFTSGFGMGRIAEQQDNIIEKEEW